MSALTRILGPLARLPRAQTYRVGVQRDLEIPMPDGANLLADRWYPDVAGGDRAPILLCRTPYGRINLLGRVCAERGYQAVSVRCRGTFGSGGDWVPFFNEQADGHAVLRWLSEQSWFSGVVGLQGASYLGFTQWFVATDPPPFVKAIAPGVTTANVRELFYPGGAFALESAATWTASLVIQEEPLLKKLLLMRRTRKRLSEKASIVPLADVDEALSGRKIDAFQEWLVHDDPDDPYWTPVSFRRDVGRVPPASLNAGWYDLFIEPQLEDFRALKAAGRDAKLTIGPWTHGTPEGAFTLVRNTLDFMDTHLKGKSSRRARSDVRVFVMGARRWVDLPDWPPPATPTRWQLQPGGRMSTDAPPVSPPDTYRYDPADPTPSIGGASLFGPNAGRKDQRKREARPDVLVYSSDVLTQDVTIVGYVTADLYVASSLDHSDFFVRLCDVSSKGKSTNLCDGILRIRPGDGERQADGSLHVRIRLFPTANTFRRGHRIRVQVSSAAHPLYSRNTGSGEPLGKATTFVVADEEVFHDPEHQSAIVLPVVPTVKAVSAIARVRQWLRP